MKKILWFLITLQFTTLANTYIEVKLNELDIKKSGNTLDSIGSLDYDRAVISMDTISFNLQGQENGKSAADVYYVNKQLKFDNGQMNALFDFSDNPFLDSVSALKLSVAETTMTPAYFNLNGNYFNMDYDGVDLHANNFFLFCTTNDPSQDMTSGDGIIRGCLTELNITPKLYESPVSFKMNYRFEDAKVLSMKGDIGKLELQGGQFITLTSPLITMDYENYDIQAKRVDLNCSKDDSLYEFETDQILKKCENTVDLKVPTVLVKNSVEETKFYFDIDGLNVGNEKLNFSSDVFQFLELEKSVTVKDLLLKCRKLETSELLDIPSVVKECISSGTVTIDKLKTTEEGRSKFPRYSQSDLEDYEPLKSISFKKSDLSDIVVSISNGTAKIKARAYKNILIKKNFDIDMTAKISFDEKSSQIILDVKDVVVPFGFLKIKWVWLIEKIIKNIIVGGNVNYNNGKFYISI